MLLSTLAPDSHCISPCIVRCTGPNSLYFYYQPPDDPDTGAPLPPSPDNPPVLFATNGKEVALRAKAVYFVRRKAPAGEQREALDPSKATDDELSFGTIDPTALSTLEAQSQV